MNLKLKRSDLIYKILIALIVYMPFHYYICELFIDFTSIDNVFRDLVILLALFLTVFYGRGLKLNNNGIIVFINAVVMVFYALISYILNAYPETFNILRTYLVPMLIYFVARNVNLSEDKLDKLHKVIIVELSLVAAYGFFQAFFLGDDFLLKLGYSGSNGYLSSSSFYISGFYGFQRSTGTFVSPNICGVILAIGLCVSMFYDVKIKYKKILLCCLLVGFLATFSRSAILGFILAFVFIWILKGNVKLRRKMMLRIPLIIIAGICLVFIVDNAFLNGLFTRMLSSSFSSITNGTDASAAKHLSDLTEPLATVIEHPFGLGFGNNGPMALAYSAEANTVESSLYLMIYELGIVFGILYFVPYLSVIVKTVVNKGYKYYVPAAVCIAVLFTYLLLPNVQTYEIIFYAFLFIGLYENNSVREIYRERTAELDRAVV